MKNGGAGHLTTTQFSMHPDDPSFAEAARPIAFCYQRAYGMSSVWNEGWVCPVCTKPDEPKKWNLAHGVTHCDECGGELKEFWPIEGIIKDLREHLRWDGAVCVVTIDNNTGRVLGGSLAFRLNAQKLDDYLELPGAAQALREQFPNQETFVYLAELFTDPEAEGQGIGHSLFTQRHDVLTQDDDTQVHVFRTKRGCETNASGTYKWYRRAFAFAVVAQYNDADDRVILAQTATEISRRLGK